MPSIGRTSFAWSSRSPVVGRISKETTYVPHAWFVELRSQPEVFSAVTAFAEGRDAIVTVNGRQSRLTGGAVFVADNYFDVLGVTATVGRVFESDAHEFADRAVVISDAMRQREFGDHGRSNRRGDLRSTACRSR